MASNQDQTPTQPNQDFDNEWTGENKYSKGFCYFVSDVNRAGDVDPDIDQSRYHSTSVYKVLSVILSGTEDDYQIIRDLVYALIKKNADIFDTISSKGTIEAVINAGRISQSTKEEMSALASLIKCPIGLSYEDYSLVFYPSVPSDNKFQVAPHGTIIMLRVDSHGRFQWINQTLKKAATSNDNSALQASLDQQEALAELMSLYKTEMPEISSFMDDSPIDIQLTKEQADAFTYDGIATQPMKINTVTTKDYFFRHKRRPKDTKQPDRRQARPRQKLPFFKPQPTTITVPMMKQAQYKDRLCTTLREIMKDKPLSFKVSDTDVKHFKNIIHNFDINDEGILVYKGTDKRLRHKVMPAEERIVLPLAASRQVFINCHNVFTLCGGYKKSFYLISSRYWRAKIGLVPGLGKMLAMFIASCPICPLKEVGGGCIDPILDPVQDSVRPWYRWSCDVYSGLAKATTGESKIVVFLDTFTRFMVAAPLMQETSRCILDLLLERVITVFGTMAEIKADNASYYTSEEYIDTMERLRINRVRFLPYSPQSNSKIENQNQVFGKAFRVIAHKDADWTRCLPLAVMAYNGTYQRTIDETPFFCAFGRDMNTLADLVLSDVEIKNRYAIGLDGPKDYGLTLQLRMQMLQPIFESKMKLEQMKQLYDKNKKRKSKHIEKNDLVLVLYPLRKKDHRKQCSPLCGPYRVLETLGKKIIIQTYGGKKEYAVHIRRCRKLFTIFHTQYIHWMEDEENELLSDPRLNMSDVQPEEIEDFPELRELIPMDLTTSSKTHQITDCDDHM